MAEQSLPAAILLLAVAALLGAAKGWFVLRRSATRILQHILERPGRQGLDAIVPMRTAPLLLLMIGLGVSLRTFLGEDYPAAVAGIYLGIGVALAVSASPFFRCWYSERSSQRGELL